MPNSDEFLKYLEGDGQNRTGKATSYVRALELLSEMIASHPNGFEDCVDLWSVSSVERLQKLYQKVREETRRFSESAWRLPGHPPSYLKDGYCSAALRAYQNFLLEYEHAESLLQLFKDHQGPEGELSAKLNKEIPVSDSLIEQISEMEGLDRVVEARARINQKIFRKILLHIYQNACCVTELDVPAVLRASHIIPWGESRESRMDPRNGLCLSATYDAAFDRRLISFDDDYRLIVSRDITDFYSSETAKRHFHDLSGTQIKLPQKYRPSQEYLAEHRKRGRF